MARSESRRLIKFGNSSFVVSLPKEWIEKNRLKKGETIFFNENSNNEVVLSCKDYKDESKEAVLNIDKKDKKYIEKEIISAYIRGCSPIVLTGKNLKKDVEYIRKILDKLSGVEMVDQDANKIVLKDLLDIEHVSPKNFIRKMDNTLKSMIEDLEVYIERGEIRPKEYADLYNFDNDVNKFYFLIWKITLKALSNQSLISKLETNNLELVKLWWISMNIERIADEIKRMARSLSKIYLWKTKKEELLSIYAIIKELYFKAMESYYKNDLELAHQVAIKKNETIVKCDILAEDKIAEVGKIGERLKSLHTYIHHLTKCVMYFSASTG